MINITSIDCWKRLSFIVGVTSCVIPFQGIAAEATYSVGVAAVDITPDYPIRLHGFGGRRAESEGVTQRIWAKALAIGSDDDGPVILFTVDNLGTRLPILDEVAARLQDKAGIKRNRIALTFSHSHTTPKTIGSADTIFSSPIPPEHQEHIDRYTAELIDALEKVALEALENREASHLDWAVGMVGFAQNRRTPGGPVDHSLPMLVAKSPRGDIRAIYVTYACHCVTLSDNKISGDWAGYAQQAIEHKHPGAIALVSIGCGSDSNPSSGVTGDNIGVAAEQGGEIANEVDRLLRGALKPVSGQITSTLQNIDLPLNELPTREALEELAKQGGPAGYNAKFQLAKLDRGEELLSAIDYPIQTITFGDSLAMVFLAGEVCVDYSLRLNRELISDRIWLHGYSNDFCSYIPSERLVEEGGYGGGADTVYFALPATLKAGLEDKIVAQVHRQLPASFINPNAPKQVSRFQPSSPEEALEAIQLGDGMIAELMAAEPLVVDPVAIDFGADGRLWVAEMRNYGHGVDEEFEQAGCITVLEDGNSDGKFDKSTAFQSGLRFPTDVKVWRKGVIVCDAPEVVYFEDTDGDGKADQRKVLLSGFETHNAQARVNSLRWGLDNWLYGSCGLFGGSIRTSSGQQLELGGRDFRFKPETGEIQAVTGRTQQGRVRDDWGNWFGCENGVLCKHYPLDDHYLARNPFVISPATELSILDGPSPNPARLFPIGKQVLFKESGPPGLPTSACGLGIYRDELLGPEFYGNAFTAEPVNQLVHRRVLSNNGITFRGVRARDESDRDFLASSDHWFRPVQVRTGLDGGLWIVDMCRYVIEHPRFIPEETLRTLNVQAGNKAGRIYRVRPKNVALRVPKSLRSLDTASLVAEIDSPNGPYRDLVHELLVERGDREAVPLLEQLATGADRGATRLQAMCALDGLSALNEATAMSGLKDPSAEVRRHAVRLSEPFLDTSPAVLAQVFKLAGDDDPQIQLQLAYSLGESQQPQASQLLAELAWKHRTDAYLQAAVLSSLDADSAAVLLQQLSPRIASEELTEPLRATLVTAGTKLGGLAQLRELVLATSHATDESRTIPQLLLAAEVLEASDGQIREQLSKDAEGADALAKIVSTARRVLSDGEQSDEAKLIAMRTLDATGSAESDLTSDVAELLNAQSSPAVQQAAIGYMVRSSTSAASDLLLERWSSFTPETRANAVDAFLSRARLLPKLIEGIESGAISRTHLDALQRQRLLQHPDETIRAAAKEAFVGAIDVNRQKIVESYSAIGSLPANGGHGRELFRKHCANCHRLEEHGFSVGPDLAALTNRSTGAMLEAIFDPNRTVEERYQSYVAVTDEGQVFTGILSSEDSNSVTLLEPEGKQRTLLRNLLEDFQNTRSSLMPEGFEKDLPTSDVADLIAYIVSQGHPPKQFAGNHPKLVRPDADGSISLLATDCEIYGPTIVFETPFKNVGYWSSMADHVAWNIDLPATAEFDVSVDASSGNEIVENKYVIEGDNFTLSGAMAGTGGWDQYRKLRLGRVTLPAGRNRVIVRPVSDVQQALMDLRGVHFALVSAAGKFRSENFDPSSFDDAAGAIARELEGLAVGTPQEYKRIPAIWESAIAAGKRNNDQEVRRLLYLVVPQVNEQLHHWQVVVIGGGVINGLTQVDVWPRNRIEQLLADDRPLIERWHRMLELSAAMADDDKVPNGTRYDALRVLGVDTFENRGEQLVRYLQPGINGELQMGAVSALGDIDNEAATRALLEHFSNLEPDNRNLAMLAMTRSESRIAALLSALESGDIGMDTLTTEATDRLKRVKDSELKTRIQSLLESCDLLPSGAN